MSKKAVGGILLGGLALATGGAGLVAASAFKTAAVVGAGMSVVGAVTGNKKLMKIGAAVGLVGGAGMAGAAMFGGGAAGAAQGAGAIAGQQAASATSQAAGSYGAQVATQGAAQAGGSVASTIATGVAEANAVMGPAQQFVGPKAFFGKIGGWINNNPIAAGAVMQGVGGIVSGMAQAKAGEGEDKASMMNAETNRMIADNKSQAPAAGTDPGEQSIYADPHMPNAYVDPHEPIVSSVPQPVVEVRRRGIIHGAR